MELGKIEQELKGLSRKVRDLQESADTPEGVRKILAYLIEQHAGNAPHTGMRGMYRHKAVQRIVAELNALQDDGAAFDNKYEVIYRDTK